MVNNEYNVLLIFFNNPKRFAQVFDVVRSVKPKRLFLYQDGPRNNQNDEPGIIECRNYAENNIDWECEVFRMYQKTNFGCDPSEYISQKWAFSIVDKCIILEDDDVPSVDFFEFCWQLLLKYENDTRFSIVCGMNNFDTYNSDSGWDYFFTSSGSIWGWATWKRVIDSWDEKYSWLDDEAKIKAIRPYFINTKAFKRFINLAKKRRMEGIEYYETILGASQMLNHQLNIVPTRNLISNIGNVGGVHTSSDSMLIPKKMRGLYYKKTYDLDFPLKGPDFVFDDIGYKEKIYKTNNLNLFEKIILKIRKIFKKIFK